MAECGTVWFAFRRVSPPDRTRIPLKALRSYSLVAVFLLTLVAPARPASLRGIVTDASSRTPLEGVECVLRTSTDSSVVAHTTTRADGRFAFDSLGAGRYLLRASLLGRVPWVRRDLDLAVGASVDLGTIALAIAAVSVPGAEVSTARNTAVIAPDRNIYLARDIPAAGAGNTTDLLRAVPELDVDVNGRVSLRGSTGVTIQINGRPTPMKGEALQTFLRQLPGSRIERVEVIANPSAKFDPEGTAGIVNIVLKDDVKLGVSGSVNAYAGPRYNGLSSRVAWQQGPLTLFGGAGASLYRWEYGSESERFSLLTSPPTALRTHSENTSNGHYLSFDTSADLALGKRTTLYGTVSAYPNGSSPVADRQTLFRDSTGTEASRSDRHDETDYSGGTASFTAGLSHVVTKGRDERSVEFLQSATLGDYRTDGAMHTQTPSGIPDETSRSGTASGFRERSLQVDDTRPIVAKAKLESGYRVAERVNTTSSAVSFESGGVPVVTPLSARSDYRHRELFHSGYVTLGRTFGKLSVQAGARAEAALTSFDVFSSGLRFDRDYRSLFPSANAAWDFGKGRTLRATYSKRIERPNAGYLNPVVPTSDSLERTIGNPSLGPRYTHSWSMDAAWTGSRGTLRLSPYLRRTVDNWDLVTTVSASGVATSTWRNASSVRTAGLSLTGSLRQTGRFGGTMSVGVQQERHDASNLANGFTRYVTGWSVNGNASFKATQKLDLQLYLRYAPPRTLAQGRASSYVGSSIGARYKMRETAWANFNVNDPFQLSKYWSETGDATYRQRTDSNNRMRSVGLSLTWTWGKIPEQKQRRQSVDQPSGDTAPAPGR